MYRCVYVCEGESTQKIKNSMPRKTTRNNRRENKFFLLNNHRSETDIEQLINLRKRCQCNKLFNKFIYFDFYIFISLDIIIYIIKECKM